jgi:Copper type II ascorbate-dependent monooxygenase, C-terminal domain
MSTRAARALALTAFMPVCLPAPALAQPTWSKDVLPVVQRRCQGCHATGGAAPFSMETWAQAAPHAAGIARMVESRAMPPWKADDACRPLKDSRRLSDDELSVIVAWARGGAPEGDPVQAPSNPTSLPALPWVDAELSMASPYTPSTARPDDYRCFVIDPKLPGERDLIGYDIVPGQRSLVHHVLLYGMPRAEALGLDAAEPGPGYTCFGGPGGGGLLGTVYGAWVPGAAATQYPAGTGVTMASDHVIVMQIHYNTSHGGGHGHSIAPDQTRIKLQLAPGRVEKPAIILPVADLNFTIPPKTSNYTTTVSFPFAAGATLHGVGPHMHTRGRQIRVSADDACLVDIPSWDFNWQQLYQFETPFSIKPGSRLRLSCTWDNPGDKVVRWGEGTDDEMCLNYFYLTR